LVTDEAQEMIVEIEVEKTVEVVSSTDVGVVSGVETAWVLLGLDST